jgi:hypothetical protein
VDQLAELVCTRYGNCCASFDQNLVPPSHARCVVVAQATVLNLRKTQSPRKISVNEAWTERCLNGFGANLSRCVSDDFDDWIWECHNLLVISSPDSLPPDCNSTRYCDETLGPGYVCNEGHCARQALLDTGASCAMPYDALTDTYSMCGPEDYCEGIWDGLGHELGRVCSPLPGVDEPCLNSADIDCAEGLTCAGSVCRVAKLRDEPCESGVEPCAEGLYCQCSAEEPCAQKTCGGPQQLGGPCTTDAECGEGPAHVCFEGKCTTPFAAECVPAPAP